MCEWVFQLLTFPLHLMKVWHKMGFDSPFPHKPSYDPTPPSLDGRTPSVCAPFSPTHQTSTYVYTYRHINHTQQTTYYVRLGGWVGAHSYVRFWQFNLKGSLWFGPELIVQIFRSLSQTHLYLSSLSLPLPPSLSLSLSQDGVWIKGLFLEGAGWDKRAGCLVEASPMQLVCPMPTIHFKPTESKRRSAKGVFGILSVHGSRVVCLCIVNDLTED